MEKDSNIRMEGLNSNAAQKDELGDINRLENTNKIRRKIRWLVFAVLMSVSAAAGGCEKGNENRWGPTKDLKPMKKMDFGIDPKVTEAIRKARTRDASSVGKDGGV